MSRFGRIGPLAAIGLLCSAGVALASPFSVTTTGTIASISDPGNLLGGAGAAGSNYVLTVYYQGLGPSFSTTRVSAFDIADAIPSVIQVTVGSHTITTGLSVNESESLSEDASDLFSSDTGLDAAGNFASALQIISSNNNFVPSPDLQTPFSYTLNGSDSGSDSYSFSNAANTVTASFYGTPTKVAFAVPEPAGWSALAIGLLGLALAGRRRLA